MLGDFASLDVQNTYRGSDAYGITLFRPLAALYTTLLWCANINFIGFFFFNVSSI
ncbi:hypothetical protein [Piscirickettsia salmonis]|uniref:hypothetical protein n=1 Tax=Piscirickettsia salmonis TaxID=1238 RepID=UPI0012B7B5D0|nr:hypothetical protein [Piscirickettsia salmonis]QHS25943.1 hypothetical protein GW538_08325 [Piscirickettsia salmonis]QHS29072.1 hypothetical protein GW537_08060 [Piscirickettsia salmonis]